jgi:hypothetical protein
MGEELGFPPCGAMMRPKDLGDSRVIWRCLGCGWMLNAMTDDYNFTHVSAGLPGLVVGIAYSRHDGDPAG